MKNSEIEIGKKYHIDSYNVSQYEGKRVVDDVVILEQKIKHAKSIIVYSPKLQVNVFVFPAELKAL